MSYNTPSNDCNFGDLRENYEHAVDCVAHCEDIIKTLQEQLGAKDEHIASLEDKLVLMSFELASSKASEDHLQLRLSMKQKKARVGDGDGSERPPIHIIGQINQPPSLRSREKYQQRVSWSLEDELSIDTRIDMNEKHDALGRVGASSMDISLDPSTETVTMTMPMPARKSRCDNAHPSSLTRSSDSQSPLDDSSSGRLTGLGQIFRNMSSRSGMQEDLDGSGRQGGTTLDDSTSSRLSNWGEFFRKNRSQREVQVQVVESSTNIVLSNKKKEEKEKQRRAGIKNNDGCRRRRPPNPRRLELQKSSLQKSSRSFIEAVVFPISFEEVIDKGLDVRKSLQGQREKENKEEEFLL